jgi:PKD repeat protein
VNYGGMPDPPVEAGSYPVSVSIADPNYSTTVTDTLTILPPNATVQLDGLEQIYDGTPKAVLVTTAPLDLAVTVTYNGMIDPPTDAGTYEVTATVVDPAFSATATATLTIFQAGALIQFGDLNQVYNGAPEPVAVTTLPSGLNVVVTYDGLTQAPSDVGTYTVTGAIDDPNYSGFDMDLLTIASPTPTAPISPRTPARGVSWQMLGGGQVFLLSWTNNSPGITVWQSADLATWTQLTNITTASGTLSIVPQDGVRFFRATVSGPNQSQAIPLRLGFPAKSPGTPAESTTAN